MRQKLSILLWVFVFGISLNANAQTDVLNAKDSANAILFKTYQNKLNEIEKQRIQDSVKKVVLEKELSQLKTTDNLKKEELQHQLEALKNKEAKRLAEKKAKIDSLRINAKGFPCWVYLMIRSFLSIANWAVSLHLIEQK